MVIGIECVFGQGCSEIIDVIAHHFERHRDVVHPPSSRSADIEVKERIFALTKLIISHIDSFGIGVQERYLRMSVDRLRHSGERRERLTVLELTVQPDGEILAGIIGHLQA